jgi:hypothetical protein
LAHSGRDPGLGVHCKEYYSKSSCYVHLVEKKKDPKHTVFYEYVKQNTVMQIMAAFVADVT